MSVWLMLTQSVAEPSAQRWTGICNCKHLQLAAPCFEPHRECGRQTLAKLANASCCGFPMGQGACLYDVACSVGESELLDS